jgi:hypothetical protein
MLFKPVQLSRRSRILVCCWAALIVLGCARSALTTDQTAELTAAEERWKRSAVRDYSFEIHPFAPLSFGQDAGQIEVRGGVVKTVTPLGHLDPPRTTIDALFANIDDCSKSGHYAKIEATYHPRLGYPTRIVFMAQKQIRDGNSIVEITAFKDLAGQGRANSVP